jgi:nitrite reductase/ring-hydroxylating ferredoxin subunit
VVSRGILGRLGIGSGRSGRAAREQTARAARAGHEQAGGAAPGSLLADAGELSVLAAGGTPVIVEACEGVLVVVNRRREVFAVEARCPHLRAPLADAVVNRSAIVCRSHRCRFDLRTGTPLPHPSRGLSCPPLRTFTVRVVGGRILVYGEPA